MSYTLAEFTDIIQATLIDDGSIYTDATVQAAVRLALRYFNQFAPDHRATLYDAVASQLEYEVAGSDGEVLIVTGVYDYDTNALADDDPLLFDTYWEDNRPYIRLRESLSDGQILIRYTIPHTISGLDDETSTTLTDEMMNALIDGACCYSLRLRAASRPEANNLNKYAVKDLSTLAETFEKTFLASLALFAARLPAVSNPVNATWAGADLSLNPTNSLGSLTDL